MVAGCSTGHEPGAAPSTSAPEQDRFGAPEVVAPRDARGAAGTPCTSLLSASELQELGFTRPGRQRTSIDVQECSWTNGSDEILAMAVNADRDLLVDTYRTRLARLFVPTTVEGLPAVRQRMATNDNRCTVTTGLGPRQALETEWSGRASQQTSDPCERAEEAIALVIRKLPPQR
ncbi:DUF3558 domain-containing protein [Actinomycetospora atypica]|uniref:DUF3558 domain-containing protein n=1 Tax=Actinomycetospora atypica TaxID=1290095 RepID=A0ABV9YP95_9PSEU